MSTTNVQADTKTGNPPVTSTTANNKDTHTPTVEELQASLELEKQKVKDTQSAYTKGQQELARLKAEQEANNLAPTMSAEEEEHLDNLKATDPDAWYKLKQEFETKKTTFVQEHVNTAIQQQTVEQVIAQRQAVLDTNNATRQAEGKQPITAELVASHVPPFITQKLANNEVSYEDFLAEVSDYLDSTKTTATTVPTLGQPTLGNTNGGNTPTVTDANMVSKYEDAVI